MMKVLIFLGLVIGALCVVDDVRRQFTEFQQKYGRVYATQEEFNLRFNNFQATLQRNVELNKANPLATFGINKFSDYSPEEFASKYLMPKVDLSKYTPPPPLNYSARVKNVQQCSPDPNNFNWVDCGATTGVYDQGGCGSCWAFSATETIESYFFLGGNSLTQFSMQQIVDCDTGDNGCAGGTPAGAYSYIQSAGGIESYSAYPYVAEDETEGWSEPCQFDSSDIVADVTGSSSISGEGGIYQQLSSSSGGPVSVCVDASTWYSYTGGIMTSCPSSIDHCVQAVGYANYGGSGSYWIVRNSWGTGWGESGFIFIAIGQDLCAIGDMATVVTASTA